MVRRALFLPVCGQPFESMSDTVLSLSAYPPSGRISSDGITEPLIAVSGSVATFAKSVCDSSTFIQVLERYAEQLQANGGKLMLAGVSEHVMEQLAKTETFETIPKEDIYLAKDTLGRATLDATAAAELWLAEKAASEDK